MSVNAFEFNQKGTGNIVNNYVNNTYLNQTIVNGSSYNVSYAMCIPYAYNQSQWISNGNNIYYMNGNVSIGSSSSIGVPLFAFDQVGSGSLSEIARFGANGTYNGSFRIYSGSQGARGGFLKYYEANTEYSEVGFNLNRIDFSTAGAYPIKFHTGATGEYQNVRELINASGSIGFGYNVSNTLDTGLAMRIVTQGFNNGLVQINTTTTTQALDVGGYINATGYYGNGTALTTININPTTSTTCTSGTWAWNDSNIFVCNSTGRYKKIAVSNL